MELRTLILAAAALACANGATAQVTPCKGEVNVSDWDPAGTNVRASPGGPIIGKVKAGPRWVQVEMTGQARDASGAAWARIKSATLWADANGDPETTVLWRGDGWVAFSKLGVEQFNKHDSLREAPSERSKVVLSLLGYPDEDTPNVDAVLGCDGEWIKVRIKAVVGWAHHWCTNQLSPCED